MSEAVKMLIEMDENNAHFMELMRDRIGWSYSEIVNNALRMFRYHGVDLEKEGEIGFTVVNEVNKLGESQHPEIRKKLQ